MADSGVLRGRKPESVQFWLAIAAVSLIFHALLIVGIKRWAAITVAETDAGPIAVEFVDPVGNAEPQGEPIVQVAAMKAEAKPQAQPEVKPEIKSEVRPEPIVESEVKTEKPTIVAKPKPEVKTEKPTIVAKPKPEVETRPIVKKPPKEAKPPIEPIDPNLNPNSPRPPTDLSSQFPTVQVPIVLTGDDQNGIKMGVRGSVPQQLPQDGIAEANLKLTDNFPSDILVPKELPTLSGEIRLRIGMDVSCPVANNDVCDRSMAQLTVRSQTIIGADQQEVDLSSSQTQKLKNLVDQLFKGIRVETLSIKTDVPKKSDTYWTVDLKLQ